MPFTEEQMQQIYNTNLIDFAVRHGFEIEKGDRNTVHVKHSGGLYLFKHGRGYICFSKEGSKGNIVDFVQEYMGASDFKSAAEMILNCRAYEQTEHYIPPVEKKPRGELVLRIGDLQNGERMLSVGFEYGGRLTLPTGQVEIMLPAAMLDGYALMLLDADGVETALPHTLNGDEATFTLDFTTNGGPAMALRLISVS